MSEIENKLESIVREFAETDEALKDLYSQLKDLESVSETYNSTRTAFNDASARLKTWTDLTININSDIRAQMIRLESLTLAMDELRKRLSDSEITTFNKRLDEIKLVAIDLLEEERTLSSHIYESEKGARAFAVENHTSIVDQLHELMYQQKSIKSLLIGFSATSIALLAVILLKLLS